MAKRVKIKATLRGVRQFVQHGFGEDSIPLVKGEQTGVAGNNPEEWRRTCLVTRTGILFVPKKYIFGMLRDAAKYTKKGKGSIQSAVAATLQIEDGAILLNRKMPGAGEDFDLAKCNPPHDRTEGMMDYEVYIDVQGVRNPSTKARNIRYRVATAPGWECSFTISFDKTIVSREQMRAVINDASKLVGLGDGRSVGYGRFDVVSWEVVDDAEETSTDGSMANTPRNRLESGREDVRALRETATANGSPH